MLVTEEWLGGVVGRQRRKRQENPRLTLAVLQLTTLSQPTRLKIFQAVLAAGREGADRAQLVRQTGVTRNMLTLHVRALTRCGLVKIDLDSRRLGMGAQKVDGDFRCVAALGAVTNLLGYIGC